MRLRWISLLVLCALALLQQTIAQPALAEDRSERRERHALRERWRDAGREERADLRRAAREHYREATPAERR